MNAKQSHIQLLLKREPKIPLWLWFCHSYTGSVSLQTLILLRILSMQ